MTTTKGDRRLTYGLTAFFILFVLIWLAGADFTHFLFALDSSVEQHNIASVGQRHVEKAGLFSEIGSGDLKAAISR